MQLRAAVLSFSRIQSPKFKETVIQIVQCLEARGVQCISYDLLRDDQIRLAGSKYLIVMYEADGLLDRTIDSDVRKKIGSLGVVVSGLRTTAVAMTKSLFKSKLLDSLMSDLEGEGLFLRNSFIINDPKETKLLIDSLDLTIRGS